MTNLYKKTLKGRTYWYLRETMRIEGKVRVKWQKYPGTPDAIKERLETDSSQSEPVRLITDSYGAVFIANPLERRHPPTVRVKDPTDLQREILKTMVHRFENGSVLHIGYTVP